MKRGKFERLIRQHAKEEIAAGVATLAMGVVVAGAKHRRSRSNHYHQLQTFTDVEGLDKRADLLFEFEDSHPSGVNLATRIAHRLISESAPLGTNGGLTAEALTGAFRDDADEMSLFEAVNQLLSADFVEIGPLADGAYGFCPTSNLNQEILAGDSPVLAQAFYNR